MRSLALALCAFALAAPAYAKTLAVAPGPDAQEALQLALLDAKPGDVVELAAGRYVLTDGLSLDIDDVTIRGAGPDATILSFDGQQGGAEGLLITSDRVTVRDFAVENSKGDGVKSKDADQISMINLRVEWTGGPKTTNGAYGVYPVGSTNVLIDGVTVRGASDAGVYVGQSKNIIVRNSVAEFNVAGIEIENSFNADVFGNTATRNTGGILVFDLPGLPQKGGHSVRVFRNTIVNNDTPNFAPAGNIVAGVPTGTGVLIMANRNVHVFENEIGDNGTVNVLISAYRNEFDDAEYNPLARDIVIRDNEFGNTGFAPAGDLAALSQLGVPIPDVLWDGATMYSVGGTPRMETVRIVVQDNTSTRTGQSSFLSLGMPVAGSPLTEAQPSPTPPPLLAVEEPDAVRIRN